MKGGIGVTTSPVGGRVISVKLVGPWVGRLDGVTKGTLVANGAVTVGRRVEKSLNREAAGAISSLASCPFPKRTTNAETSAMMISSTISTAIIPQFVVKKKHRLLRFS